MPYCKDCDCYITFKEAEDYKGSCQACNQKIYSKKNLPTKKNVFLLILIPILLLICYITWKNVFAKINYQTNLTSTYSNYHKCEYLGCNNFASGTQYCSQHTQTKCIVKGCSNKEAYSNSKYCKNHLLQDINKRIK